MGTSTPSEPHRSLDAHADGTTRPPCSPSSTPYRRSRSGSGAAAGDEAACSPAPLRRPTRVPRPIRQRVVTADASTHKRFVAGAADRGDRADVAAAAGGARRPARARGPHVRARAAARHDVQTESQTTARGPVSPSSRPSRATGDPGRTRTETHWWRCHRVPRKVATRPKNAMSLRHRGYAAGRRLEFQRNRTIRTRWRPVPTRHRDLPTVPAVPAVPAAAAAGTRTHFERQPD